MKKITILLLLFVSACAYCQTSVKAELDSAQILIGDQAVLSLSITSSKGSSVEIPQYKAGNFLSNGVEIVEVSCDTTEISDEQQLIQRRISITAWDEGTYTIPSQTIKVGGKTYNTNQQILKVLTIEVDTLHPEQIKPAKDVMDNPFSWLEWLPLLGWIIVVGLLVVVFICLRKLLMSNKRIFSLKRAKKLLPHEKALMSIEKIKQEQQEQLVDQKTYYTQLTDTLREYLEDRFSINAMEMTSGEIVDRLMAEDDMTKIEELRELFMTADLVKFAKYSTPNNENEMYLANVAQFVEETKSEEQPQMEPSEVEMMEEERQKRRQRMIVNSLMTIVAIAVVCVIAYIVWQIYELLM